VTKFKSSSFGEVVITKRNESSIYRDRRITYVLGILKHKRNKKYNISWMLDDKGIYVLSIWHDDWNFSFNTKEMIRNKLLGIDDCKSFMFMSGL